MGLPLFIIHFRLGFSTFLAIHFGAPQFKETLRWPATHFSHPAAAPAARWLTSRFFGSRSHPKNHPISEWLTAPIKMVMTDGANGIVLPTLGGYGL